MWIEKVNHSLIKYLLGSYCLLAVFPPASEYNVLLQTKLPPPHSPFPEQIHTTEGVGTCLDRLEKVFDHFRVIFLVEQNFL